jgi:succinate dehydrogenase / fumarate reductase membrane anchor subunit
MLAGSYRRAKPAGSNFELYSWYFFRVSGVLLLFLVFGHLTIMHIVNNVDVIDYRFVALRWENPFWRNFDLLILFLAILHGSNGVRVVIDDYVRSRGWRVFAQSVLYTFTAIFILIGSIAVLTFQPEIAVR